MNDTRITHIRQLVVEARNLSDDIRHEQPQHPDDAADIKKIGQYLRWALSSLGRIEDEAESRTA